MQETYADRRKIDPTRGPRLADGSPNDNDRVEIGPTQLAFAEWDAAGITPPNLERMRERPGARMSGGEQQMLTIARTLMGNPAAILLDEPSEGLAPLIVEQMARTILELKAQGVSVLLCEQNLHFARQVADRAYVIEKGHVRRAGTLEEIEEDYQQV